MDPEGLRAQISVQITDCSVTPIYRVLELVKIEGARYGVAVINSEIKGSCPAGILMDAAEYYLQLSNFKPDSQIIENYLY